MPEIQKADSRARRTLIVWVVLLSALAFTIKPLLAYAQRWLDDSSQPMDEKLNTIAMAVAIAFVPLLILGIQVWRMGSSVVTHRRFPSPTMRVVVDTPIVGGWKATLRGRLMQLAGVFMWACAVGVPIAFWYVLNRVINSS